VIGIGVNCAHHPAGTDFPATDLAAAGVRATPESLFGPLSATMVSRLAQWDRGAGFATVRADWLARATGLGKPIRLSLPEGERSGVYEGIDERGCLVLRLADGTMQAIAAGDVLTGPRH
jgi:BirA family biotin operon repressor/biotin-[acetyl-CoA-carboxylase] ligase